MNTQLTIFYRRAGFEKELTEVCNFPDDNFDTTVHEGVLVVSTAELTLAYAPGVWTRTETVRTD